MSAEPELPPPDAPPGPATISIKRSHIDRFFDEAAPHLSAEFAPKPLPDVSIKSKQLHVQELAHNADHALAQVGDDLRGLEASLPALAATIEAAHTSASDAERQAERLQREVVALGDMADGIRRDAEGTKELMFMWVVQLVWLFFWIFGQLKRIVLSPRRKQPAEAEPAAEPEKPPHRIVEEEEEDVADTRDAGIE
jgi:hypothetical protein